MIPAIAIIALVVAAALAIAFVGGQGPHHAVVPPGLGTPSPSPSASTVAGPCTIPDALTAEGDVAASPGAAMSGPAAGRVAFVAEGQGNAGQVLVAGGGASGTRVAAVFSGLQPVQVVGSSGDGSVLLVASNRPAGGGPATHRCGDLFFVRSDGTAVTKLTVSALGVAPQGEAVGPDGRSVAYVEWGTVPSSGTFVDDLRLIDAAGATRELDASPCGGGLAVTPPFPGELVWSPDGSELAVTCASSVAVYPVAGGAPRALALPSGTLPAAMAWSRDGRRIIVAAPKAGASQLGSVTVLSLDAGSGATTVVSQSRLSLEWIIPFAAGAAPNAFSPDGRWLLAPAATSVTVPGSNSLQGLYLINVASGGTRQVLGEPESLGTAQWLPDSTAFVFQGTSNNLEEMGFTGGAAKTIGSFAGNAAFFWVGP